MDQPEQQKEKVSTAIEEGSQKSEVKDQKSEPKHHKGSCN